MEEVQRAIKQVFFLENIEDHGKGDQVPAQFSSKNVENIERFTLIRGWQ